MEIIVLHMDSSPFSVIVQNLQLIIELVNFQIKQICPYESIDSEQYWIFIDPISDICLCNIHLYL